MLLTDRSVHVSGDDDGTLARGLEGHGARLAGAEDAPVDVVVHVVGGDLTEQPLAGTDAATWMRRCDEPLLAAVRASQEARRRLRAPGGRLVFVVPSLGLTGAAGLVPLATVAEGVRSLAKTAARQFGPDGITVSCVARFVGGPVVAIESLPPPSDDDVAATVALLASPQASAVTGATLVVDGGTVLVP